MITPNITEKIKNLFLLMGFSDVGMNIDEEYRRISLHLDDERLTSHLMEIVSACDHIINRIIHKEENVAPYIVDVNYYRKERERLIVELTRAAARKAVATKKQIELPPMNGYERRLVHVEITTHPELKTESVGIGKDRHVVIRHFE